MSRLVNLREMGELHWWIVHKDRQRDNKPPRQVREMSKEKPKAKMIADNWFEADLPALSGPRRNRP